MKIAVIGGGAAGMMFSTQYKKANPNDEVFVFEKSQYVAWAGCPTPYYIADELSFNDVVLGTPEDFIKRGVNVKTLHKVTDIDFKNKTLNIEGNDINGIFEYDKLVIAVGAKSFVPNIDGYSENLENVFTLSHAEHAIKIKEYINDNKDKIKKAVVVGAGFIGLETAEAFNIKNLEVTVVEKAIATELKNHLKVNGTSSLSKFSKVGFKGTHSGGMLIATSCIFSSVFSPTERFGTLIIR